jgi:O-antigen ligase
MGEEKRKFYLLVVMWVAFVVALALSGSTTTSILLGAILLGIACLALYAADEVD